MNKRKILVIGTDTDELVQALLKLSEAGSKADESIKLVNRYIRDFSPIQTKFGKGDRRKNKKQFMNQINRKR